MSTSTSETRQSSRRSSEARKAKRIDIVPAPIRKEPTMTNDLAIPSNDPNGHQREHLRVAGAGLVRYLMRARLKVQQDAFRPKQIARWELEA